jgi:hypothetical protein
MSQADAPVRLPYSAPTLVTYGHAATLTLGKAATGPRPDGGSKAGKTRTG